MEENMTDKQMEILLTLVADKFSACKTMEDVEAAVKEVREMAKKEKPADYVRQCDGQGGRTCRRLPHPRLLYSREEKMSKRIKEAREEIGMSRAELAREFGMPIRTLENWDREISSPPMWVEKLILEKLETFKK